MSKPSVTSNMENLVYTETDIGGDDSETKKKKKTPVSRGKLSFMLAVSKKELAVGFDHSLLNHSVWFNPGHTGKQQGVEGDDLWCCALN